MIQLSVTLEEIDNRSPHWDDWTQLIWALNERVFDVNYEKEITLRTLVESYPMEKFSDIEGFSWFLMCYEGIHKPMRWFTLSCAESVIHTMKDARSVEAIKVARSYLEGVASDEELKAACVVSAAALKEAEEALSAARAAAAAESPNSLPPNSLYKIYDPIIDAARMAYDVINFIMGDHETLRDIMVYADEHNVKYKSQRAALLNMVYCLESGQEYTT